ncbi:Cys/Met metabolism PLP-dependent enzyme-domain-containing protein [Mycena filopes]|nr:Cys/Met metabolism PLP-dependent enzyme-domain-containing protein [Mycena filopes]
MLNPFYREPDFETLQLHAGYVVDPTTNARAVPIYQSTSFILNSVEGTRQLVLPRRESDCGVYPLTSLSLCRNRSPSDVFEKRMAALEGGMAAVATASGQAATALTITSLAATGDNIVSSSRLYGGTYTQFKVTFQRYGITTKFITTTNPADYAAAIDEKTKAIFVETIANTDTVLIDIAAIAKVAHDAGIPLVVDNTVGMGGWLIRPITLGADIVVHSATKWISGHGTTLAGVIIDSGKFDWKKSRNPMIAGNSVSYGGADFADIFFPVGFALQVRLENLRDLGPCLSATSAFMVLQGVETLSLRAERHCQNALAIAKFLEGHPRVTQVTYLGLPSHPSHELAVKTLRPGAFGGLLTFRVQGGSDKVKKVVNNLKLASHLANLGDANTLVIAPFVTIQSQLTPEEREKSGVTDDMIRSVQDLIADLEGAFKVAYE